MIEIAELLKLADAYIENTGIPEKTASFRMFKDTRKLTAIRGTEQLTVKRFNEALCRLAEKWPDDLDWPNDIYRPTEADITRILNPLPEPAE